MMLWRIRDLPEALWNGDRVQIQPVIRRKRPGRCGRQEAGPHHVRHDVLQLKHLSGWHSAKARLKI